MTLIHFPGREVQLELTPEPRPVKMFVSLDDCLRDVVLRDECVKFDLHGLWWSVPMELNIHTIDAQIRAELERLDCRPFPAHLGDIYRPTIA